MLDTVTGEFYKLPDGEMLLEADGNEYTKTNWIKVLEIKQKASSLTSITIAALYADEITGFKGIPTRLPSPEIIQINSTAPPEMRKLELPKGGLGGIPG